MTINQYQIFLRIEYLIKSHCVEIVLKISAKCPILFETPYGTFLGPFVFLLLCINELSFQTNSPAEAGEPEVNNFLQMKKVLDCNHHILEVLLSSKFLTPIFNLISDWHVKREKLSTQKREDRLDLSIHSNEKF